MLGLRGHALAATIAVLPAGVTALFCADQVAAQSAPYFSSTYAASDGSPYSEVYARTFGAGGQPAGKAAVATATPTLVPLGPPLVTSAPPAPSDTGNVVYVIENGRLLTYSGQDYARGGGEALEQTLLAPAGGGPATPRAELPSIANRLYGSPPLETAAGAAVGTTPIPLYLPQN
ncbi:MAG: hypothetical protein RH942_12840 [Kiloniellaceae bacterium]